MDQFVATAAPVMIDEHKQPRTSFRLLFLFLLLATLASAGATTYILMTGNPPQVVPQPAVTTLQTTDENPFADGTVTVNPFAQANASSSSETVNAFSSTEDENPFAAFETTSEAGTSGTYENPF